MLYVTTRDRKEIVTVCKALTADRGPCGGLYIPYSCPDMMPVLERLTDQSISENIAAVLNALLGCRLDSFAVELAVGKSVLRIKPMSRRIWIGESWHNPAGEFAGCVSTLMRLIVADGTPPGAWAFTCVRIAMLFAAFGEVYSGKTQMQTMDVSIPVSDFSGVMAAWFSREWGLPIGDVIVCCNENDTVWQLLHYGELPTGRAAAATITPDCDQIVPSGMEQLICLTSGDQELSRWLQICGEGKTYFLEDEALEKLRSGLYGRVISSERVLGAIRNIYHTAKIVLDPYSALAYCGILDHRVKAGETRPVLLMSEISPLHCEETVCSAMGLTREQLKQLL